MREILFRGKIVNNKEWVYGYLYITHDKEYEIGYYSKETDIERMTHVVMPETVGQYTGLTDKNGIKIFEGDIISIPFEEDRGPWEENCTYYEKAKVYFDTKRYGWYVDFFDTDELSLWEYDETDIEVIGNIHDNPELTGDVER